MLSQPVRSMAGEEVASELGSKDTTEEDAIARRARTASVILAEESKADQCRKDKGRYRLL